VRLRPVGIVPACGVKGQPIRHSRRNMASKRAQRSSSRVAGVAAACCVECGFDVLAVRLGARLRPVGIVPVRSLETQHVTHSNQKTAGRTRGGALSSWLSTWPQPTRGKDSE
jgi:hypothetical protein